MKTNYGPQYVFFVDGERQLFVCVFFTLNMMTTYFIHSVRIPYVTTSLIF